MDISFRYLFLSIFLLLVALPLYYKIIPPNYLIGFKEKRIIENRKAWYVVNRFFGLQIMKSCLFLAVLSLAIPLAHVKIMNTEIATMSVLLGIALYSVLTTNTFVANYFRSKGSDS